jgi:Arc/MetJ family transcription regulator
MHRRKRAWSVVVDMHRRLPRSAHHLGMRRPTTIDIDMDLVREAGVALGTTRMTETVHAALEEVVRRHRLLTLLELRPALDLDDLRAVRAHRFAERPGPYGEVEGPAAT